MLGSRSPLQKEVIQECPLESSSDCAGSVACAASPAKALCPLYEGRLMWKSWWFKLGVPGTVEKVKVHGPLRDATALEDTWGIRGNRLAGERAKRGAYLLRSP